MSGPFDRRSPGEPDPNAEWPAEDRRAEAGSEQDDAWRPAEPWRDPPRAAPESSPWDDWPPITPPDLYDFGEPLPPSSDPWAESWTDEAAGGSPFAEPVDRPARSDYDEPAATRYEPEPEPEPEPDPAEPAIAGDEAAHSDEPPPPSEAPPTYEPPRTYEPDYEPSIPFARPAGYEPPVSAPPPAPIAWQPDIAPDWLEDRAEVTPAERGAEWDEAPAGRGAQGDSGLPADHEPEGAPEREFHPAPEPEPGPAPDRHAEPEAAERDVDAERDAADIGAGDAATTWTSAHETDDAQQAAASLPPAATEHDETDEVEWRGPRTWVPGNVAQPEREAEPPPVPQADVVADAARDRDGAWHADPPSPWAPAPVWQGQPDAEPDEPETVEPDASTAIAGAEGAADDVTATAPAVEAEVAPQAPEIEPERDSEPDPEPALATAAELPRAPEPEPEVRPDRTWPREPGGEPTEVYPSSWAPTPPDRPFEPAAGVVRTAVAQPDADVDELPAEHASTAEQAVPWLIGVILLLAGMVIVLMALIFAGDASLGGIGVGPSGGSSGLIGGSGDGSPSAAPSASSTARASRSAAPSATATATPIPGPQYGALEVLYQGRNAPLAPIYLLLRDFTEEGTARVLAQDPNLDVRRFAWAPDGTVGVAVLAEILVSVEPDGEKRRLSDGIGTAIFGADASTIYTVSVTQEGTSDTAVVGTIDFETGEASALATVTYERPLIPGETPLEDAQLADEGGTVRLYWMEDETLLLWVMEAGAWEVDPETGDATETEEAQPVLWSPDGTTRVEVTEGGGTSSLRVIDDMGDTVATATFDGLVSHIRWSPNGDRLTFTGGRLAPAGGVLQDLFLWDPAPGNLPEQLTSTGAAFGAEWRGSPTLWRPAD